MLLFIVQSLYTKTAQSLVKEIWFESWSKASISKELFSYSSIPNTWNTYIMYSFRLWNNEIFLLKIKQGLSWWRSGWESACQCRGHGLEPWSGKIPYAAEQLGPWATTAEPERLEPLLHNKRGCDNERPTHRDEEWPPLAATGESPHTETKTQHSQK